MSEDFPLFPEGLHEQRRIKMISPASKWKGPSVPFSTQSKSELIADYIRKFQQITRGGLYVDGFAAPQRRNCPEAWTAKRVLEVEPKRIRGFWLFDIDPIGVELLKQLKAEHHKQPASRKVRVFSGDFNEQVIHFLQAPQLKRDTAVFALLDQRSTECHWSTVQRLASRKGRSTKIELMYFCPTSWVHRILKTRKLQSSLEALSLWWGNEDWTKLRNMTQAAIVQAMADRFVAELGYKYVVPYPIPLIAGKKRTSYHLIHASDHVEAPRLMAQSFNQRIEQQKHPGQLAIPFRFQR